MNTFLFVLQKLPFHRPLSVTTLPSRPTAAAVQAAGPAAGTHDPRRLEPNFHSSKKLAPNFWVRAAPGSLPGSRISRVDTAPVRFFSAQRRISSSTRLLFTFTAEEWVEPLFHLNLTTHPHTDGDTDRTCPGASIFPSRRKPQVLANPPLDAISSSTETKNCQLSIRPQPLGALLSRTPSLSSPYTWQPRGVV